jgi:hypothetical protein
VILCTGLAMLAGLALLVCLGEIPVTAQAADGIWRLTAGGGWRLTGWSPDGLTVLVNRWGRTVAGGESRQVLSELWAVRMERGAGSRTSAHPAVRLSENAIEPRYAENGQRLAYLSFAGGGRWEARVLELGTGRESSWGGADWRMRPLWIDSVLARANKGRVWQSGEGAVPVSVDLPTLPAGARVRLSGDGARAAWSDGTRVWTRLVERTDEEPRLLAEGQQVLSFDWSLDGGRLAYVVAAEGPSPELWVADVEGDGTRRLLLRGEGEVFSAPSWSPDGRVLAFSRTPSGAGAASAGDIWLVNVDGGDLHPLWQNDLEENEPVWSPDGRYLAFNRDGDVWVVDIRWAPARTPGVPSRVEAGSRGGGAGEDLTNLQAGADLAVAPMAQQTPPATIRVIHDAVNECRDVPVGQIDFIDFEEYVKRVVPNEVYTSWPMEVLKAQAVAARAYGWYYTEKPAGQDYDVTDWTSHQAMCDRTYSSTNSAVEATRGQYIAYQGEVIKAFFSAKNGCPTRSLEGYPYILAVDDPVSFGEERWGHGWGMSQWGAYRWAAWHGWGYQQILAHYYTGVTVELPSTGGPEPMGGLTLPWSDHFITSNRVYLAANASDESSAVGAVGFYAVTDTTTLLVTDTVGSDGWSTVWDVAPLSDTTTTDIDLTMVVTDEGYIQPQEQIVRIGLDRQPPRYATAAIPGDYTDTLTVTVSSLSATDPNPGSGLQAMAFGRGSWIWEGEELYPEPNSGEVVDDEDALNGRARCGLVGQHIPGAWYGPYTYILPPGHAYRAYFRLKTSDVATTAEVATLDVADGAGERILGLRRLRGTDFRTADTYQEFSVDLDYTSEGTTGLEFRTAFRASADLCLDRVLIVSYPVDLSPSAQWRLTPGEGLKTVTVKFIDGAGNVSTDVTSTVTLSDTRPPEGWRDFAPEWWIGGDAPSCSVRVFDEISGLDVDSARYRFSTDGGLSWSGWAEAQCTGDGGTVELQTITVPAVGFGQPREQRNQIEFQITDMAGHVGSAVYVVRSETVYLPLALRR